MNNRLFPQLLGKMGELIAYVWLLNQGYKNVCLQGQDNNDHDLVYTDDNGLMKTVQVKSSASPNKYGFKFKLRFSEGCYMKSHGGKSEISNSDFFIFIFYYKQTGDFYLIKEPRDIVVKNNRCEIFYFYESIRKENYVLTYKLNEFKNDLSESKIFAEPTLFDFSRLLIVNPKPIEAA
jgi:hypothetical protein